MAVTIKGSECWLCVCACVPPDKHSYEDNRIFFFFFNFSPHFHDKRVYTRTYIWPRLRAGPKHLSSQERVLEVTRRAQIQDSTGPQSKRTKHCFGTVIIRKYYVHISKLTWWCQGTLTATGQSFSCHEWTVVSKAASLHLAILKMLSATYFILTISTDGKVQHYIRPKQLKS